MFKKLSLIFCSYFFSCTVLASPGISANFTPPETPTSTLLIDLPSDTDLITLTTLGVELDGVDITAMLTLTGEDFSYVPVTPLSGGNHVIRLVQLTNPVKEIAKWNFSINIEDSGLGVTGNKATEKAEKWFKSGSFRLDTSTEFSDRTWDDDLNNSPDSTLVNGAGDLNVSLQGKNSTFSTHANYLLQTDHTIALTGKTLDIGEYDINFDYSNEKISAGMTLGHHDIGSNSLVFHSFYRRGASIELGTADQRVRFQGFAFNPESLVGANNFTGLNDSQSFLNGVSATVKPFSNEFDALKLTGVYYTGEGQDSGTGISAENLSSEAEGWAAILEKSFIDGRLTLRGEYAKTNFDIDGDNGSVEANDGDGVSFVIETRPFKDLVLFDKHADFQVGFRYDEISTFFQSLGNEGLANDRDAVQIYGNLYWGSLSGTIQYIEESNNVDNLASLPTNELQKHLLNLYYNFDRQTESLAWLGTPYINFYGFVSDLERKETPLGYEGYDTDNASNSITLGGGSTYEKGYWTASHTLSSYDDDTDITSDTENSVTSLSMGWAISQRLNLDAGIQRSEFKDIDNNQTSNNTNYTLGINSIIIPEKLNFKVNYNLNLSGGDDDSPNREVIDSEIEYVFIKARSNSPGLSLSVRGALEDKYDSPDPTQNEDNYQIFTVLRVTAPIDHGF